MADNSLTDISGVGPKTAEKLRDDGYTSKEGVLEGFKDGDPTLTNYSSRVVRGIRGELLDRGDRFRDPETNVEVGPENRKAFEVFGQTTVSDLDSVDTRYGPASAGTSLAELAPKAASGELGQRGYGGQSITDFAADAAANLGLTDMSGAAVQEMNRRETNPTAARLGTPRPKDPYGVSVADEPPADLTNPERLVPKGPSVRVRDEPGERLELELDEEEANVGMIAARMAERNRFDDADEFDRKEMKGLRSKLGDAREEGDDVELRPSEATTLSSVVSAALESERFPPRRAQSDEAEAMRKTARAADPESPADLYKHRITRGIGAVFDAEPAVQLSDLDRRDDNDDDAGGGGNGGASQSQMQFDATPAVQLSDRGTDGDGLSIGPRGTAEIDPGVGGFGVADDNNTSTRLRDDKGREVTITRRKSGAHGRRKSFGVSMQTEKGRSLGSETVSERVSFGSYADQGVEEAADEVESIIAQMGASRFAMNASEQQMQFDATPAVQLFDRGTSGGDSSRPPAGDVLDSGPGPTAEMLGTGLAPGDTRIAREAERQSRRRQTGDRPDDLAEQLAAQRAAPTVTRPDADPAVQLTDTDRLQDNQESGTVTLEGQTQSVADTAVGYAEQRGLVDEGLRDRVGGGELTPEDAGKVNTALLSFEAGERDIAREGRTTLMGSPESHEQWADWAREARQDAFGRFGPGGPSAEPPVSLLGTGSGGEQPEPAPTGAESLEDPDLIRLRSSGRFNRDPTVDEPAAPGQRAPANGRFVGDSDNITRPADPEEPIMRDPQTGQFVVTDR